MVFPNNKPCKGSIVGKDLLTLDDGESVCVVLLILVVRPSCPPSRERVVSPLGRLVTFVRELFGVRRSSMLYLKTRILSMKFRKRIVLRWKRHQINNTAKNNK